MPCRVDPTPDEIRASREAAEVRRQKEKDKLLVLTQTVCWAMRELIKERGRDQVVFLLEEDYGKDHVKWWKQHEKNDAARLKREKAANEKKLKEQLAEAAKRDTKKRALAKLTKAEREALGLS